MLSYINIIWVLPILPSPCTKVMDHHEEQNGCVEVVPEILNVHLSYKWVILHTT